MKKTVLFITCSAFILLSVSCSIETAEPIASDTRRMKMEFNAEMTEVRTKTAINPDAANAVYWSKGDEINIFTENGNSDRFVLAGDGGSASGTFTGETVQSGTYYALYPYSSAATYSGNVIKANLPATQYCTSTGTFDTMLNPAVAVSDGDNSLSFKNVAGLLELTFTNMEGKSVKEISLKAAESLAGDYTIDMSGQNYAASAVPGEKSVGVNLVVKAEETRISDPVYYLVLLPGAYSNLSLTVIYDDYSYMSGKLDSFTVKAGELRPQKVDASKATANADGLYGLYQAGIDIEVGGVAINKETYGDAVFVRKSDVDETAGTPKVAEQKCVYFLEAGAKLYWDTAKPESLDKSHFAVIVISDALDRSATLTRNVPDGSSGIKKSTIYFGKHTKIVMKNVTYDFDRGLATDGNNDDVCHFDFIADNCNLNFNTNNASLVKKNKSGRLNSLIIRNSTVVMPKNKIKVIDGGLSGVEGEASVIMENTRFYSNANAGEAIDGMSIGNLSCAMKSVIIKNNIFMELPINDAAGGALIQANSVSDLDLSGNIFYKTAFSTADRSAVLSLDSAPSVEESQWNDNICVISEPMALAPIYDGLGNYVFRMTFTDALDVFQSIEPRQGAYVLKPEYASYGPQENLK